MKALEANVRKIEMDGLVWGLSKLVAVGYGIKKLQINLVVEDDKVSIDELQQKIEEDEDNVQSTDVVCTFSAIKLLKPLLTPSTGCHGQAVDANYARAGGSDGEGMPITICTSTSTYQK